MRERKSEVGVADDSKMAELILWPRIDGVENVQRLLSAVETKGGRLYIHGSAARAVEKGEETFQSKYTFGDIDFVVTGIEGHDLELLVREVMGGTWDVGARRHREEGSPIKTIEMARNGKLIAEVVCARKNDRPDTIATIEDHLQGCFTPDGKLVAFEINKDDAGNLQLRRIEREVEIILNAETVRPDHVWLWFHSLVTGKVTIDKQEEVQEMIRQFMAERGEKLVMWRKPDEALDEWMARRKEVQGVEPSRVKEINSRSFGKNNVEGIAKKLDSALETDPEQFLLIGMKTGLLPKIFPIFQVIHDNPVIGLRIRQSLEDCRRRGVKDVRFLWQSIFKPVLREIYRPFRECGYIPPIGRGRITLSVAYSFLGNVDEEGDGKKVSSNSSQETCLISWRRIMTQLFSRYHEERLSRLLTKQDVKFSQYEILDGVVKEKVARELALLALEDPTKIYSLLTSYLPINKGKLNREIWDIALVANY